MGNLQAIVQKEGSEELYIGIYEDPVIGNDDLLVEVKAAAINRGDLLQKKGLYPPPPGASTIIGLEMAGEVVEAGSDVKEWKPGDRVYSILPGGGYAKQVSLPAAHAMRIPDNLSFVEAAAIPEAYLTAYLNMHRLGGLKDGENVLIHAGASGVGTAAIQLAREAGARAFVTAGSQEKLEVCRSLGAEVLINYKEQNFQDIVLEHTNDEGVQLILDSIGAPYWEQNIASLAKDGRWVIIGVMGGVEKTINLREVMRKHAKIIGSTLRARTDEFKADLIQEFVTYASPRLADGRLKPVIDSVYNWKDVNEAHQHMAENKNIGKVILEID